MKAKRIKVTVGIDLMMAADPRMFSEMMLASIDSLLMRFRGGAKADMICELIDEPKPE